MNIWNVVGVKKGHYVNSLSIKLFSYISIGFVCKLICFEYLNMVSWISLFGRKKGQNMNSLFIKFWRPSFFVFLLLNVETAVVSFSPVLDIFDYVFCLRLSLCSPAPFSLFQFWKRGTEKKLSGFYLSLTFFPNLFFLVYFLFLVFISFLPSINTRAILLHHSVFPQCLEWVVRSFFSPLFGIGKNGIQFFWGFCWHEIWAEPFQFISSEQFG